MKRAAAITILLFLLLPALGAARPILVFLTDFGIEGDAVGLCHGAALAVNPDIEIVDLCHTIRPYDIRQAARTLKRTEVFPGGTVLVSVIDPGVGTTRSSIAIRTRSGIYYIAPNNGILTLVVRRQGADAVYELEPGKINPRWIRGTFDGRDLYSPAGALLASSGGNLDRIGRPIGVEDIVLIDFAASVVHKESRRVTGEYTETDYPYGNVWTNITEADLVSAGLSVGGTLLLTSDALALEIPFVTTFADVPKGAPLAYINSDGALAFALNMGNFQRKYGLKEGAKITVAARH